MEDRDEKFDIIVGDLADPVEGGPCYQLYTKSFYENILKPKLTDNGVFVTQVDNSLVFWTFYRLFFAIKTCLVCSTRQYIQEFHKETMQKV